MGIFAHAQWYSITSVENGSEKPSFFYCFGNLHEDIFVFSRPLKHCLNAVFPPDFNQYESFFVTPCTTSHGSTNSSCNSQAGDVNVTTSPLLIMARVLRAFCACAKTVQNARVHTSLGNGSQPFWNAFPNRSKRKRFG